jgi:3-(3-hydroxy-phenyl)propionate hydroxylase
MSNTIKSNYDIIIIGAGPCGVTAANILGQKNISTLVIDKEADIVTIPRAVGICEEGSRILDSAGLLEKMGDNFRLINRVNFNKSHDENVFHADTYTPINGHRMLRTFHQPELERNIRGALKSLNSVDLFTSTELISFNDKGDAVEVSLKQNGSVVNTTCRYLLACDGASSKIRQSLNIGFDGNTYPQEWMILDIEKNPLPSSEVIFSINPERPSVTLPGPGNKRRWEFVVKKDDDPKKLFEPENLAKLLAPWGDINDMEISRKAVYTFHARTANNYQKGNVFLLGDSAHITPPFAGQGLMAGLRDCYNLCWKLSAVIHQQLDPKILESYEKERIPQSRQVIKFAQYMGKIILPQNKKIAKLRDTLIGTLGFLGFHSNCKGMPIDKIPNHINGSLIRNKLVSALKKTGIDFPQSILKNKNDHAKLFDQHIKSEFYIIGWNTQPNAVLSQSTLARWHSMNGESLMLSNKSIGSSVNVNDQLFDQHEYYRTLFKGGERFIVIRPDKIMVLNCNAKQLDKKLNQYMDLVGCLKIAA